MIDTLRLKIPIIAKDNFVSEFKVEKTEIKTGETTITMQSSEKYKLKSSDIQLNILKLTNYFVEIEFSLPKLLVFSNVFLFSIEEQYRALELLKNLLYEFFNQVAGNKVELFEIDKWLVQRVDLAFNYKFQTEQDLEFFLEYLNVFFKSAFTSKKDNYYQDEGAYFSSRYYTFKVYSKYKEFLANDYSKLKKLGVSDEVINLILKSAEGVLRFELELRKDALFDNLQKFNNDFSCCSENAERCEFYGCKNPERLIELKHVLNQDFQEYALNNYLSQFCLKFEKPNTLSESEIRDLLIRNYGSSHGVVLFDFYQNIQQVGLKRYKIVYSQIRKGIKEYSYLERTGIPVSSTFYKRLKELKQVGLSFLKQPKDKQYSDFDLFGFANPDFKYSVNNTNKQEKVLLFEHARDLSIEKYKKELEHEIPYFNRVKNA